MDMAWWTLDELVERVGRALDAAARDGTYPGAPNGRVRDLPDRRAIRWYATIGLVDRPAASRGRGARYGPRHLRQLVAVKRRQAEGRTLAEIQAELAGADDVALAAIADVPDVLLVGPLGPDPDAGSGRGTGDAPDRSAPGGPALDRPTADRSAVDGPVADRFWTAAPSTCAPAVAGTAADRPAPGLGESAAEQAGPRQPVAARTRPPDLAPPVVDLGPLLTGVPLHPGVTLLLTAAPDADDLAAITAAAQPLLHVLTARGLVAAAANRRSSR